MPDGSTFSYHAGPRQVFLEPVDDAVAVALRQPIPEPPQPIPEPRRAPLQATTGLDALARSPALLNRGILIRRPSPAARAAVGTPVLAERMARAPSVRFVTRVFRHADSGLHLVLTDEIVVRLTSTATRAELEALNTREGVEIIEQSAHSPRQYLLRVQNPSTERILELANAYHASGLCEWAEPNWVTEKRLRQDLLPRQWHLENTGQTLPGLPPGVIGEDIHAKPAWAITKGSGNVTIAILDTGVEVDHAGLGRNMGPNARNGSNFDGGDPNNPNPDADPTGGSAHGTSCAGVAAGAGGRISGSAPDCKLQPVKMLNADNNRIADSAHFAAHNAQVLSNSWGAPPSAVIEQAFTDVMADGREGLGTVVLFAVGNDNARVPVGDQSTIDGVIGIAASTNVGSRAAYSNFGDAVDSPNADINLRLKRFSVAAPSAGGDSLAQQGINLGLPPDNSTENIYTTDIQGAAGFNPPKSAGVVDPVADPDYTGLFSGTSSSCPLAAGVCALMLSVNASLTRAQVKYVLEGTADKIGTGVARADAPTGRVPPGQEAHYEPPTGYDVNPATGLSSFGFGRVNAEQAVRVARGEALRQFVRNGAPPGAYALAMPVVLRRQRGTNRFVSEAVLELIDARRDAEAPPPAGRLHVRGGPGGFVRADLQPAGGGPAITDEVDVQGQAP